MKKNIIEQNGVRIAVIESETPVITDGQSALDLIADVFYNDNCECIAINEQAFCADFFKLSTGIAGEVLQKFVNYNTKLAITGNFDKYTSKPLQDFIYECNKGKNILWTESSDGRELIKKFQKNYSNPLTYL